MFQKQCTEQTGAVGSQRLGVGSVQSRNLIRYELLWNEKGRGKRRAAEDVPEQGTRCKPAGQDWLEGDRKIWKEIQPSADVPTLATALLISSGVWVCTREPSGGSNPSGILSSGEERPAARGVRLCREQGQ